MGRMINYFIVNMLCAMFAKKDWNSQRGRRGIKDRLKEVNQIFNNMYLFRRKLNSLHQSSVKTFL